MGYYFEELSEKEKTVNLEETKIQNPVEMWMKSWVGWQDAGSPFPVYAKSWEMFFSPNSERFSKLTDQWSKSWNFLGVNWPMNLNEMSPKQLSSSTFDSFRNVDEFWSNSWFGMGNEFVKAYFQMIQNFSEQFQKLWK